MTRDPDRDNAHRPSSFAKDVAAETSLLGPGHPLVELRSSADQLVELLGLVNLVIKADQREDLPTLRRFLASICANPAASDHIRRTADKALEQIRAGTYTFAQD